MKMFQEKNNGLNRERDEENSLIYSFCSALANLLLGAFLYIRYTLFMEDRENQGRIRQITKGGGIICFVPTGEHGPPPDRRGAPLDALQAPNLKTFL